MVIPLLVLCLTGCAHVPVHHPQHHHSKVHRRVYVLPVEDPAPPVPEPSWTEKYNGIFPPPDQD